MYLNQASIEWGTVQPSHPYAAPSWFTTPPPVQLTREKYCLNKAESIVYVSDQDQL